MKRMGVVGLLGILLLAVLLFLGPYNVYHHLTREARVKELFAELEIREAALGESSDIVKVTYLGKRSYHVETEVSSYVIKMTEKKSSNSIEVFEKKQQVRQTNVK
ncbi:hypothetical protein IM538_03945 [Cytobacillus suaedae]|nr:hypothetical protein IM538_03945 [Cytobacillus suaedae]